MSLAIRVNRPAAVAWFWGMLKSSDLLLSFNPEGEALYIVRLSDGRKGVNEMLRQIAKQSNVKLVVWRSHTPLVERWSRDNGAMQGCFDREGGIRWAVKNPLQTPLFQLACRRYGRPFLTG